MRRLQTKAISLPRYARVRFAPPFVPKGEEKGERMSKTNLRAFSNMLPETWRSKVVGLAAGANVKVLRMDGTASGEKPHAYAEGLLVLDGELKLGIGGEVVTVAAGEIFIVPANTPHAVAAGSHGTLVIIDQDE
jgi:quercetin dioxygenase-like cupin family protein